MLALVAKTVRFLTVLSALFQVQGIETLLQNSPVAWGPRMRRCCDKQFSRATFRTSKNRDAKLSGRIRAFATTIETAAKHWTEYKTKP